VRQEPNVSILLKRILGFEVASGVIQNKRRLEIIQNPETLQS
jgi:hypothetical protein